MAIDPWLPIGCVLPDGAVCRLARYEGPDWQIFDTQGGGRALVAGVELHGKWISSGLMPEGLLNRFERAGRVIFEISSGSEQLISPVVEAESTSTKSDALAFALAMRNTREIDSASALQDAIYVEKISLLLPTYSISARTDDDVVLGYWLSGGAMVSAKAFRRLRC